MGGGEWDEEDVDGPPVPELFGRLVVTQAGWDVRLFPALEAVQAAVRSMLPEGAGGGGGDPQLHRPAGGGGGGGEGEAGPGVPGTVGRPHQQQALDVVDALVLSRVLRAAVMGRLRELDAAGAKEEEMRGRGAGRPQALHLARLYREAKMRVLRRAGKSLGARSP